MFGVVERGNIRNWVKVLRHLLLPAPVAIAGVHVVPFPLSRICRPCLPCHPCCPCRPCRPCCSCRPSSLTIATCTVAAAVEIVDCGEHVPSIPFPQRMVPEVRAPANTQLIRRPLHADIEHDEPARMEHRQRRHVRFLGCRPLLLLLLLLLLMLMMLMM